MFNRLFKPRTALVAGRELYNRVVPQARRTDFYAVLGAPDTAEGRFELYTLHVYLLLERMKGQGPQAAETAQALFDTYASALDNSLREMGVGDVVMGKRMRKLGEAFYGRVNSYEKALAALPDEGPLNALLARTVFAGVAQPSTEALAAYILKERASLARQPLDDLLAGDVVWSTP